MTTPTGVTGLLFTGMGANFGMECTLVHESLTGEAQAVECLCRLCILDPLATNIK